MPLPHIYWNANVFPLDTDWASNLTLGWAAARNRSDLYWTSTGPPLDLTIGPLLDVDSGNLTGPLLELSLDLD